MQCPLQCAGVALGPRGRSREEYPGWEGRRVTFRAVASQKQLCREESRTNILTSVSPAFCSDISLNAAGSQKAREPSPLT